MGRLITLEWPLKTFDWYWSTLIDISVNGPFESPLIFDQCIWVVNISLSTNCWSNLDAVSMLLGCWPNVDWVSTKYQLGCQSRLLIDTRLQMSFFPSVVVTSLPFKWIMTCCNGVENTSKEHKTIYFIVYFLWRYIYDKIQYSVVEIKSSKSGMHQSEVAW